MNRKERIRYEMFVRVRDFGTVSGDVFPESSTAGEMFAQMATTVAAIEQHHTSLVLARAEARKVKSTTRAAVFKYMKVIARTGQRVTANDTVTHPFRIPRRRAAPYMLSTARAFIAQAAPRQAEFVRLGLSSTFLSEFQALVDALDEAVQVKLNSGPLCRKAQAGIDTALTQGNAILRDLDVAVENGLHDDPVRLAQWQRARHIDGQGGASAPATTKIVMPAAVEEEETAAEVVPPVEVDLPTVADETDDTLVQSPSLLLDKAS